MNTTETSNCVPVVDRNAVMGNLVVSILKNTYAYAFDRIGFKALNNEVKVWKIGGGAFYDTGLIPLFTERFNTYLDYNSEEKRVELKIFWY